MKDTYFYCRKLWFVIWCMLFLVSCSTPMSQITLEITEASQNPIDFELTTMPKTPTPLSATLVRPTSTFIDIPTSTSSPTKIPTWTLAPRLSADEALIELLEIYEDNGRCQVPCWWGIVSGETSWQDVHSRLTPLGDFVTTYLENGMMRYDFQFSVPGEIDPLGYFWPALLVKDNLVEGISINSRWISQDFNHSVAGILDTLGLPDGIWIKITPTANVKQANYNLQLVYVTKGVKVGIEGVADLGSEKVTICPQINSNRSQFPPSILLWSASEKITFKEIPDKFSGLIDLDTSKFRLLEDLTNEFNNGEFHDTYLDPSTITCIDIPISSLK